MRVGTLVGRSPEREREREREREGGREREREGGRERTLRSHELPSPQDYVGEAELKTMTGQLRAG